MTLDTGIYVATDLANICYFKNYNKQIVFISIKRGTLYICIFASGVSLTFYHNIVQTYLDHLDILQIIISTHYINHTLLISEMNKKEMRWQL
jgi:hypothetical protein